MIEGPARRLRCSACGKHHEQRADETEQQARDRHDREAEREHDRLRTLWFELNPGVLDAIEEDQNEGW